MLIKPDSDTTTALARLARGAEWPVIEAWLRASRENCVEASLSPDEVQCRKAQGGLLVIDELIKNTRASVESATRR